MIDHSKHGHPSTPAARALCRANGGTGVTTKPSVKNAPKSSGAGTKVSTSASKQPPREKSSPPPKIVKKPNTLTDVTAGTKVTAKTADRNAAKKPSPPRPMSTAKHSQIMGKSTDEEGQVDALLAAPVGIDSEGDRGFKSGEEKNAAEWYVADGYTFVNSYLRGQSSIAEKERVKDTIKHLDAVMERSKLTEDTGVYRGVGNGQALFGDALDGDLTGLEWREKGYSSTTVNEDVADDFVDSDDEDDEGGLVPIKMRIALPKGTSAFQASDVDEEAELVLGRNSNFRVVKDRGEDDMGVRVIDVELVP